MFDFDGFTAFLFILFVLTGLAVGALNLFDHLTSAPALAPVHPIVTEETTQ